MSRGLGKLSPASGVQTASALVERRSTPYCDSKHAHRKLRIYRAFLAVGSIVAAPSGEAVTAVTTVQTRKESSSLAPSSARQTPDENRSESALDCGATVAHVDRPARSLCDGEPSERAVGRRHRANYCGDRCRYAHLARQAVAA